MAESRTGKSKLQNPNAYTLIEILWAIVILSGSLAFILPSFYKSMDALNHLSGRADASFLGENLIQETQASLAEKGTVDGLPLEGKRSVHGREYRYELKLAPQDRDKSIYEVDADIRWSDFKDSTLKVKSYVFKNQ